MKVGIEQVDNISRVLMDGELDGQSAPHLESEILPLIQPNCKILLDMSGVSYISSIGLRALLLLHRETSSSDGRIAICCMPEMIYDTMLITGFLDFFEAYDSSEEALTALRANG